MTVELWQQYEYEFLLHYSQMGHSKLLCCYFSPSVIQGGPGFPFFHPHVYVYLFSGIWSQTNIDLDCIPDDGLRKFEEDVSLKTYSAYTFIS